MREVKGLLCFVLANTSQITWVKIAWTVIGVIYMLGSFWKDE